MARLHWSQRYASAIYVIRGLITHDTKKRLKFLRNHGANPPICVELLRLGGLFNKEN